MLSAPIPDNEPERIASLRRMLLLSTPDEESFDRVTRIAQRLFEVPIVLVSLIDDKRQWFKSCIGLPVRETGREISFCGHAIHQESMLVVEDARKDPRFADNPLVTGTPNIAFYAGRPLANPEGFLVGTLCLIDRQPRIFDQADRRALDDLACWAEQVLAHRELGEAQKLMLGELDTVRRQSMLDPQLNIWREDAVRELLQHEVLRAHHARSPLAVLAIEIVELPKIVAQQGVATGDTLRRDFSRFLRSLVRAYDNIGCCGEHGFMIVLPGLSQAKATETARRITGLARSMPFAADGEVFEISLAIGLAVADYAVTTPEPATLAARATDALQAARHQAPADDGIVVAPAP